VVMNRAVEHPARILSRVVRRAEGKRRSLGHFTPRPPDSPPAALSPGPACPPASAGGG
jgi:hypothetical protein